MNGKRTCPVSRKSRVTSSPQDFVSVDGSRRSVLGRHVSRRHLGGSCQERTDFPQKAGLNFVHVRFTIPLQLFGKSGCLWSPEKRWEPSQSESFQRKHKLQLFVVVHNNYSHHLKLLTTFFCSACHSLIEQTGACEA